MRSFLPAFAMALCLVASSASSALALTKLSSSGICHDEASPWFENTKNFTEFPDLVSCLAVGRLPKTSSASGNGQFSKARGTAAGGYDRGLYGDWADLDGDCLNTRHEVLQSLSTGPVTLAKNGCSVSHGRWNDPYTNQIFTNPRQIDIDHMVPLAWAHAHGAAAWTPEQRVSFANDPVNLFAVEASANREKGAKGPLEWLPPNQAYRCEYVTRFHRLVLRFGLSYAPAEAKAMDRLRAEVCS